MRAKLEQGEWIADPTRMVRMFWLSRFWNLVAFVFSFGLSLTIMGTLATLGFFMIADWVAMRGLFAAVAIVTCVIGSVWAAKLMCTLIWRSRHALAPELELFENPEDPGLTVVESVYFDNRRVVGVDRGVIWRSGGLLHFRGVASYFGLVLRDVYVRDAGPSVELVVKSASTDQVIRMSPLHVNWIDSDRRFVALLHEFKETASPEEPRMLPPFERYRRSTAQLEAKSRDKIG